MTDFRLRAATPDDARAVWEWRNDPVSRQNARNTGEIDWPAHQQWFAAALADPARMILIAESGTAEPLGTVRFDLDTDGLSAEVSLILAPDHRGRGLAMPVLSRAVDHFIARHMAVLTAHVREGNIASRRAFERAGFAWYEARDGFDLFKAKRPIIDAIERVRSRNNVNWMDLMRLAFRVAPHEAEAIFRKINTDDGEIARLLALLTR